MQHSPSRRGQLPPIPGRPQPDLYRLTPPTHNNNINNNNNNNYYTSPRQYTLQHQQRNSYSNAHGLRCGPATGAAHQTGVTSPTTAAAAAEAEVPPTPTAATPLAARHGLVCGMHRLPPPSETPPAPLPLPGRGGSQWQTPQGAPALLSIAGFGPHGYYQLAGDDTGSSAVSSDADELCCYGGGGGGGANLPPLITFEYSQRAAFGPRRM